MKLTNILTKYKDRFLKVYGNKLNDEQRYALDALCGCRSGLFGEVLLHCGKCQSHSSVMQSCGHRNCNQCHHHDTVQWLDRQQQKLLPTNYFLITFTLPAQLRPLAYRHQTKVYNTLFDAAASTLKSFFASDRKCNGQPGFTCVLHTHSRNLSYHPHVHVVIPAGAWDPKTRQWSQTREKYLFCHKALASVFRALF